MPHIDATTPQLKLIARAFEAYETRDRNIMASVLSKDFTYETLPKTALVPIQKKEEHLEFFGQMFAKLVKLEVRVQYPAAVFVLKYTPIVHHPRCD